MRTLTIFALGVGAGLIAATAQAARRNRLAIEQTLTLFGPDQPNP